MEGPTVISFDHKVPEPTFKERLFGTYSHGARIKQGDPTRLRFEIPKKLYRPAVRSLVKMILKSQLNFTVEKITFVDIYVKKKATEMLCDYRSKAVNFHNLFNLNNCLHFPKLRMLKFKFVPITAQMFKDVVMRLPRAEDLIFNRCEFKQPRFPCFFKKFNNLKNVVIKDCFNCKGKALDFVQPIPSLTDLRIANYRVYDDPGEDVFDVEDQVVNFELLALMSDNVKDFPNLVRFIIHTQWEAFPVDRFAKFIGKIPELQINFTDCPPMGLDPFPVFEALTDPHLETVNVFIKTPSLNVPTVDAFRCWTKMVSVNRTLVSLVINSPAKYVLGTRAYSKLAKLIAAHPALVRAEWFDLDQPNPDRTLNIQIFERNNHLLSCGLDTAQPLFAPVRKRNLCVNPSLFDRLAHFLTDKESEDEEEEEEFTDSLGAKWFRMF